MCKPVKIALLVITTLSLLTGCSSQTGFKLDFEKYTIDNGLDVVLHHDKSDPIVAVAILYHVGSNREQPGRTGFAHLFEHMLFQESQHVGQDQFFKKIQDAGGELNGGTSNDLTIYYEVVPKNALEMVLWMESDRMGYLLSKITQEAFENQQGVVQNEKRQRVDNQPYGHTSYVIDKLLYPEGHPYNWQVIGEMDDLRNATLKDVHDFHKKWYGPNNATLVIAGDFDNDQVGEWIEKYFGEIKPSDPVSSLEPRPVTLSETKRAYHLDPFAQSPELNMVFPTVQEFSTDSYALDYLGILLGGTKKAPLYQIIVEERKLAPAVSSYQGSREVTGSFRIGVRAFPNIRLTDVEEAIKEALARFETDRFTAKDLERLKTQQEVGFYSGISSVLSKAFQLSRYNEFAGTPDFIHSDLENYLSVTEDDIWRVYRTYIKDRPYVLTSFVPQERDNLIAADSHEFPIKLESLDEQITVDRGKAVEVDVSPIPSGFDRSQEPSKGPDPLLTLPEIWQDTLPNGIDVWGIEHHELPLITFSITVPGGDLADEISKPAVADLLSSLMMEGTAHKTPVELEEAIDELGASIYLNTGSEEISLNASTLASKYSETIDLVREILFEPRWDEKEFVRIKNQLAEGIKRIDASPSSTAGRVFSKLVYGADNIFAYGYNGTPEGVQAVTMEDLKSYYSKYLSPNSTYISIVGDISQPEAVAGFENLAESWPPSEVSIPGWEMPAVPERAQLYLVDFPGAMQSEIRIGYPALKFTDPDYYPVQVMNYKLGGNFNSSVNLILREEKGYTYGASTGFSGSLTTGIFSASAAVQASATAESVQIFRDEMEKYRQGVGEEDIVFTKNSLIKSNSRRFETLGALLGMLNSIAKYDLPLDYVKQQEEFVHSLTLEKHREFAQRYIHPERMIYLVVGDRQTQLEPLSKLGFGNPILLDKFANKVQE